MPPKLFVASKAVIEKEGKILLIREAPTYADSSQTALYDIPGGRIEPGQTLEEALLREIKEEVGIEVRLGVPFFVNEVRRTVRGEEWQIIRVFYAAPYVSGDVTLSADHDAELWASLDELKDHPVIDNLAPVFARYAELINSGSL